MKHAIVLVLIFFSPLIIADDPESLKKQLQEENHKLCCSNECFQKQLIACSAAGAICDMIGYKCYNKNTAGNLLFASLGTIFNNFATIAVAISVANHASVNYNRSTLIEKLYKQCNKMDDPHARELYKKYLCEENQKLCHSTSNLRKWLIAYGIIGSVCTVITAQCFERNDWSHIFFSSMGSIFNNLSREHILVTGINHVGINYNTSILVQEYLTQ